MQAREAAVVTSVKVQGECDNRFRAVRDALGEVFVARGEVGIAVAAYVDGKPVVDLWAGHADAARSRPWQRDTMVLVHSTTKGMTAICAHRLVERGLLDLDSPVAEYWPEFAQAGKETLPVRYLLSHRAGLPAVRRSLPAGALFEWDTMTAALAAQEPWWAPGTKHGYHALTYGFLVGELVKRISGKSLGTFFREEVAEPLGVDFHIGFGPELDARVADIVPPAPDEETFMAAMLKDPESIQAKAFNNPPRQGRDPNDRDFRAAELPAANGHGTARALARVYGALAQGGELEGVRVLTPQAIDRAIVEQSNGPDAVLGLPMRFGLGFMLTRPDAPWGPNPRTFGHPGLGGSLGFADPDAGVGFGFVVNRLPTTKDALSPRHGPLVDALYASL